VGLKSLKKLKLEMRTIRSWISLGLLPGPDSLGRNAGYGQEHIDRLRAICRLRQQEPRLSLTEIRMRLQALTPDDIRALAEGRTPIGPAPADREKRPSSTPTSRGGSPDAATLHSKGGQGGESPTARAVRRLEAAVGRTVPSKARIETWHRIGV